MHKNNIKQRITHRRLPCLFRRPLLNASWLHAKTHRRTRTASLRGPLFVSCNLHHAAGQACSHCSPTDVLVCSLLPPRPIFCLHAQPRIQRGRINGPRWWPTHAAIRRLSCASFEFLVFRFLSGFGCRDPQENPSQKRERGALEEDEKE